MCIPIRSSQYMLQTQDTPGSLFLISSKSVPSRLFNVNQWILIGRQGQSLDRSKPTEWIPARGAGLELVSRFTAAYPLMWTLAAIWASILIYRYRFFTFRTFVFLKSPSTTFPALPFIGTIRAPKTTQRTWRFPTWRRKTQNGVGAVSNLPF